jgi:hypothetical protein
MDAADSFERVGIWIRDSLNGARDRIKILEDRVLKLEDREAMQDSRIDALEQAKDAARAPETGSKPLWPPCGNWWYQIASGPEVRCTLPKGHRGKHYYNEDVDSFYVVWK